MTTLTIEREDRSTSVTHRSVPHGAADETGARDIAAVLSSIGVGFERWEADGPLASDASADDVLTAYAAPIARLSERFGFRSVDVVRMHPEHPGRAAAREKFLAEHTHDDFEVRFFVEGQGRFYLHVNEHVYIVTCFAGDLLSVPAGTRHWFDMGERPRFTAIRLFTTPDGWAANFTANDIATRFPTFDPLLLEEP